LERLPTGCPPIDELLGGGFRFGEISLIYGEASTGKTTIALSCVTRHLQADPWAKAFYVDSDQKLSTQRMIQIADGDESLLERLLIWRPADFRQQTEVIEDISELLSSESTPLIVDSVTGLYRLEAGDPNRTFRSNKELNRDLGFLAETAKAKRAAVLVTGQVRSILGDPPQVEPVAHRLLRYWSETVLKLESTSIQAVRQATLEKPTDEPKSVRFRLADSGLEEVGRPW
jgi:DNA repair protein RadB